MAKKEATLILKVKQTGASIIDKMKSAFGGFVITAGDVVDAIKFIGRSIIDLAQTASQFKSVERAFENMAIKQGQDADAMLAKMRELSRGTVSDLELMKQANQAMLLGLPVDRLGEMMEIARSAAKSTGQSMEFMLSSIVTGLGRGSKLMLDNLGIVIDTNKAYENYAGTLGKTAEQLTEAERKQAFINEALAIGKANAEAAGGSGEDLGDVWAQISTIAANLATKLGVSLLPAVQSVSTGVRDMMQGFNNWIDSNDETKQSVDELTKKMLEQRRIANLLRKDVEAGLGTARTEERIAAREAEAARLEELIKQQTDREVELTKNKEAMKSLAEQESMQENAEKKLELMNQQAAMEIETLGISEKQKLDLSIKALDKKLKVEKDHQTRMDMLKTKQNLLDQKKMITQAKIEADLDAQKNKDREAATNKTLSTISSLQGAHNKGLVALGKAAAIAQITINTARGVSEAYKMGPVLGPILAPIVVAAGAAQAARVSGVKLAEGGVVRNTPGGIQATIGEGGRDEAVVPLPDDFDPDSPGGVGGGNTININVGAFVGDERQAQEFAEYIDNELFKLRQNNNSVAFDQALV